MVHSVEPLPTFFVLSNLLITFSFIDKQYTAIVHMALYKKYNQVLILQCAKLSEQHSKQESIDLMLTNQLIDN